MTFRISMKKNALSLIRRSFIILGLIFMAKIAITWLQVGLGPCLSEKEKFLLLMEGPLSYDDQDVLSEIREKYLVAPSRGRYNLTEDIPLHSQNQKEKLYLHYKKWMTSWIFYDMVVKELFNGKSNLFFVEAGALDGEYMSNSLHLEKQHGWAGLLVEPDQKNFKLLVGKNRKAWKSPVCLSKGPYPYKGVLQVLSPNEDFYMKIGIANTMVDSQLASYNEHGFKVVQPVICFPLQSLLMALNVTHVDLLILDIEGLEDAVISHFPWEKITVDVLFVEHPQMKNSSLPYEALDMFFIKWVENFGFKLYSLEKTIPDFIFIRQDAPLFKSKMQSRPPDWNPETLIQTAKYIVE